MLQSRTYKIASFTKLSGSLVLVIPLGPTSEAIYSRVCSRFFRKLFNFYYCCFTEPNSVPNMPPQPSFKLDHMQQKQSYQQNVRECLPQNQPPHQPQASPARPEVVTKCVDERESEPRSSQSSNSSSCTSHSNTIANVSFCFAFIISHSVVVFMSSPTYIKLQIKFFI